MGVSGVAHTLTIPTCVTQLFALQDRNGGLSAACHKDSALTKRRFIAVATEVNVLNLVAVAALGDPEDELLIIADARMKRLGNLERLEASARERRIQVRVRALDDWTLQAMLPAAEDAVADWGEGVPREVDVLAIGGRKHDMLVLSDLVRRRAEASLVTFGAFSVDRRPLKMRLSRQEPGEELRYVAVPLSKLDHPRRLTLDEVLSIHGYRRHGGVFVPPNGPLPPARGLDSGKRFEVAVLRLVRSFLSSDTGPFVSQLWWGVPVLTPSGHATATEFDVLLLACDGSVVHFECKTARAAGMQHKVFQLRQIFTPESRFVICHAVHSGMTDDEMLRLRADLLMQYENVDDFELLLFNPQADPCLPLGAGLPSPADEVRRILNTAWVTPA